MESILSRVLQQHPIEHSDAECLRRYLMEEDTQAFAQLVTRHGPLVYGIAQRVLGRSAEVDDVFQAVFLALSRQARSIRNPAALSAWLHGVTVRIARKAKIAIAKRAFREREAQRMRKPSPENHAEDWQELRPLLDEEVDRLDEKYRLPVILCYFEGKSYEEAAAQLGWPSGSISGRLHRAREVLRKRLLRRGVNISAAALALLIAEHAHATVPSTLLHTTIKQLHTGLAPIGVEELARVPTGPLTAWKMVASIGLTLSIGVGLVMMWPPTMLVHEVQANRPAPALEKTVWDIGEPIQAIAHSADRRFVFLASGSDVIVWDRQLQTKADRWKGHTADIAAMAISPSGDYLASAGHDQSIRIWDIRSGKPLRTIRDLGASIVALAFQPGGHHLASGSWDGTVRVHEVATGREHRAWEASRGRIWSVAWEPGGQVLFVAGTERLIREYGIDRDSAIRSHNTLGSAYALSVTGDGRSLISSEANRILIRHRDGGRANQAIDTGETAVPVFTVAADGRSLWCGGVDGQSQLIEIATGQPRLRIDANLALGFIDLPTSNGVFIAESSGRLSEWRWPIADPGSRLTNEMWTAMQSEDAAVAFRTMQQIQQSPDAAIPWVKERLCAVDDPARWIAERIQHLDDSRYARREAATAELIAYGPDALPIIERTLGTSLAPEPRRRLEQIRGRIQESNREWERAMLRALECLERIGTPAAQEIITRLADRDASSRIGQEARTIRKRTRID